MAASVGFIIKPVFDKGAKAEASKLSKELKDQGRLTDQLNKSLKKTTIDATKGFRDFGKQVKENSRDVRDLSKDFRGLESDLVRVGRAGSSAFQNIGKSILGANAHIRDALGSVVNLKNAIIGSAVVLGGRALIGAGREERGVERRVRTEFGEARAKRLQERAGGLGERAAVGNAEALAAVAEIARATSTISEGQTITDPRTGKRRKLTAAEAARLQGANTNFGVNLLERAATLRPDVPIQELAAAIASAGTDETGFRNLASVLHLNRGQVHNLLEAQQKGKIGALLTPEERKRLGISANQRQVGFGSLIDIAFQRSGLTEQAAASERRTRGFDRRLAGKKFADFKAEEGQQLDALLGRFGGPNMAANAEKAIDALRGNERGIATAGVAGYALSGLLSRFNIKGTGKNAAAELSDELSRATGGAVGEKAIPTRVINFGDAPGGGGNDNLSTFAKAGLVALSGVAGFTVGRFLDKKLGLSDELGGMANPTTSKYFSGIGQTLEDTQNKILNVRALQARNARTSHTAFNSLVGAGASPEYAKSVAQDFANRFGGHVESQKAISIQIGNISTAVGQTPKQIAETLVGPIAEALAKHINVQTAGGVAP